MSLVNRAVAGVASEYGGGGGITGVHTEHFFITSLLYLLLPAEIELVVTVGSSPLRCLPSRCTLATRKFLYFAVNLAKGFGLVSRPLNPVH